MSRKYFLTQDKNFYKACMHTHTSVSDGKFSPEETKKRYKEQGYSIIAFTDHEVLRAYNDLSDDDFLTITSYEYDLAPDGAVYNTTKMCHLNFYARNRENKTQVCFNSNQWIAKRHKDTVKYIGEDKFYGYSQPEINYVIDCALKNGFIVCYNHPAWSNETLFDYMGYNGFFAMEVYNHGCASTESSMSEEWNMQGYDALLRAGRRIFPIFSDDAHNPNINSKFCDAFGGYIMVNAQKLEYDEVFSAIERGDFYASMAPEIYELYFEDGKICVKCSEAREIKFLTAGRDGTLVKGEGGAPVTYGEYKLGDKFGYVRVEVIDKHGKIAATRGYFEDEIL